MKTPKNAFLENLKETFDIVLLGDYSQTIKWNGEELEALKLNTPRTLKTNQLSVVIDFAHHYELNVEIARSGAGLKIEFTPKQS